MPLYPNRRTLLAAAASAPLAALPASAVLTPAFGASVKGVLNPARLKETGALIDRLVKEGRMAGGSVRIAVNGKPIYEHYAGKADLSTGQAIAEDTIFRVYSMTKPVTAAAVMLLAEDGTLALTDPVTRFVPEFENLKVYVGEEDGAILTEPSRTMRVIDLLTHTSGISNSWNPGPIAPLYRKLGLTAGKFSHDLDIKGLPDVAARMAKAPLQFQPGSRWLYSFAPDIAGLVVQRASSMRFGAFLKSRIFEPLEMSDTDFFVPEEKVGRFANMYALKDGELILAEPAKGSPYLSKPTAEAGASGLVSTLGDYGRFASMLARCGELGGVRVMRRETARTIMSNHVSADILGDSLSRFMSFGAGGEGGGMGFGLGGAVMVSPDDAPNTSAKGEYTWGGAASTTFFVAPRLGLDATLMTQLFPSGTLPLLDWLKSSVYQAYE